MAENVATLGFAIDSTQVKQATPALEGMAAAADRATKSAESLNAQNKAMNETSAKMRAEYQAAQRALLEKKDAEELAKEVTKAHGEALKMNAQYNRDAARAAKENAEAGGILAQSMSHLKAIIGTLGLIALAHQLYQAAKEAMLLTARFETLGVASAAVARNAGYTTEAMEKASQAFLNNGMSVLAARESTLKLAQSYVDLSNASKLAEIAANSSIITNTEANQAFESLLRGIESGREITLRMMGINADFQKSYRDMARELNTTVDLLSEYDMMQARVNAVVEAGERIVGTFDAAMLTAGQQMKEMQEHTENLKVAQGEIFQEALLGAIGLYVSRIDDATKATKELSEAGVLRQWGRDFVDILTWIMDLLHNLYNLIKIVVIGLGDFGQAVMALGRTAGALVPLIGKLEDAKAAWDDYRRSKAAATAEIDSLWSARGETPAADAVAKQRAAVDAQRALAEQLKNDPFEQLARERIAANTKQQEATRRLQESINVMIDKYKDGRSKIETELLAFDRAIAEARKKNIQLDEASIAATRAAIVAKRDAAGPKAVNETGITSRLLEAAAELARSQIKLMKGELDAFLTDQQQALSASHAAMLMSDEQYVQQSHAIRAKQIASDQEFNQQMIEENRKLQASLDAQYGGAKTDADKSRIALTMNKAIIDGLALELERRKLLLAAGANERGLLIDTTALINKRTAAVAQINTEYDKFNEKLDLEHTKMLQQIGDMSLTQEQATVLNAQRRIEAEIKAELDRLNEKLLAASRAMNLEEAAAIRLTMEHVAASAGARVAQAASDAQALETAKQARSMWQSAYDYGTNAIRGLVENWHDGVRKIGNDIKEYILNALIQLTMRQFIIPVVGAMLGMSGSANAFLGSLGATGTAGGAAGFGSLLSGFFGSSVPSALGGGGYDPSIDAGLPAGTLTTYSGQQAAGNGIASAFLSVLGSSSSQGIIGSAFQSGISWAATAAANAGWGTVGVFAEGAAMTSGATGAAVGQGTGLAGSISSLGSSVSALGTAVAGIGVGFVAGNAVRGLISDDENNHQTGAAVGAVAGAYIGSIFPVVGTFIGAVIGGIIGGIVDGLSNRDGRAFRYAAFGSNQEGPMNGAMGSTYTYKGESKFGDFGIVRGSDQWFSDDEMGGQLRELIRGIESLDNIVAANLTQSEIAGARTAVTGASMFEFGKEHEDINPQALGGIMKQRYYNIFKTIDDDMAEVIMGFDGNIDDFAKLVVDLAEVHGNMTNMAGGLRELFGEDIGFADLQRLQQEGETFSQTLSRLAGEFAATNMIAVMFGKSQIDVWHSVGLASEEARASLIKIAGGTDALTGKLNFFYENFYSAEKRRGDSAQQLNDGFAGLGVAVPATIEDFRRLAESQDMTSEAGQRFFNTMMDLAPAFYNAQRAADAMKDSLREAVAPWRAGGAHSGVSPVMASLTERNTMVEEFAGRNSWTQGLSIDQIVEQLKTITPEDFASAGYSDADRQAILAILRNQDTLETWLEQHPGQSPFDTGGLTADMIAFMRVMRFQSQSVTGTIGGEVTASGVGEFQREGEGLHETLSRLVDEFKVTNRIADLMGKTQVQVWGSIGLASTEARETLIEAAGGLQALSSKLDFYYQNFYSDAERSAMGLQQVQQGFTALNVPMPDSIEGFRDMVNGIDVATEAGAILFNQLMDLAPGFYDAARAVIDFNAELANLSKNIQDDAASTRRTIETTGMSNEEKYRYLQTDANKLRDELAEATDPQQIADLTAKINADIREAFGLLSPEEQVRLRGEFLQSIDGIATLAQERLDKLTMHLDTGPGTPGEAKNPDGTPKVPGTATVPTQVDAQTAALRTAFVSALETFTTPMTDAATKQVTASETNAAAAAIALQAAQQPVQVVVTIPATRGSEVGL